MGTIKRRTADLLQSVPRSLPSVPQMQMPQMPQLPRESLGTLRRRTTDMFQSMPESLTSMSAGADSWFASMASETGNGKPQPMRGTWEKISVPPLLRSSHSVDVVAGTAYIFGGEVEARLPVDNAMHAVTLPFSGAPADCYAIKAVPASPDVLPEEEPEEASAGQDAAEKADEGEGENAAEAAEDAAEEKTGESRSPQMDKGKGKAVDSRRPDLGEVPAPRVGHATAVIGSRIFLFGGRGGPDMAALEEAGRVWVFDTRTRRWTYHDPAPTPDAAGVTTAAAYPAPRSYHSAVATDKPAEPDLRPAPRRAESWYEWAEGDSAVVGTPQAPTVGNIAASATDTESEGYGTFIVHGGCLVDGTRTGDVWAFDVRSRVWQELPTAPGKPRGGTALCLSRGRLYRFGGFNGDSEEGGQLDCLELGVDSSDGRARRGEVTLAARGSWHSYYAGEAYKPEAGSAAAVTDPLSREPEWPGHRSVASLEAVTAGDGREYLVLSLGERDPSGAGHAAAGKFWDDVWAFQVPAQGMSAVSITDQVWTWFGYRSGEGRWRRLEMAAYDERDAASAAGPGPRGWAASSTMGHLEDGGIVLWGGLNRENRRLGDGWILRLD